MKKRVFILLVLFLILFLSYVSALSDEEKTLFIQPEVSPPLIHSSGSAYALNLTEDCGLNYQECREARTFEPIPDSEQPDSVVLWNGIIYSYGVTEEEVRRLGIPENTRCIKYTYLEEFAQGTASAATTEFYSDYFLAYSDITHRNEWYCKDLITTITTECSLIEETNPWGPLRNDPSNPQSIRSSFYLHCPPYFGGRPANWDITKVRVYCADHNGFDGDDNDNDGGADLDDPDIKVGMSSGVAKLVLQPYSPFTYGYLNYLGGCNEDTLGEKFCLPMNTNYLGIYKCVKKCDIDNICDDKNPCTEEKCVNGLCEYENEPDCKACVKNENKGYCYEGECTNDKDNDSFITAGKHENATCLGDCNDNNASINPDAEEICNDLIDNNCDEFKDCEDYNCHIKDCEGLSCNIDKLEICDIVPSANDISFRLSNSRIEELTKVTKISHYMSDNKITVYDELNCTAFIQEQDDYSNYAKTLFEAGKINEKQRDEISKHDKSLISADFYLQYRGDEKEDWKEKKIKYGQWPVCTKNENVVSCYAKFRVLDILGEDGRGKQIRCRVVPQDCKIAGEEKTSDEKIVAQYIYYFFQEDFFPDPDRDYNKFLQLSQVDGIDTNLDDNDNKKTVDTIKLSAKPVFINVVFHRNNYAEIIIANAYGVSYHPYNEIYKECKSFLKANKLGYNPKKLDRIIKFSRILAPGTFGGCAPNLDRFIIINYERKTDKGEEVDFTLAHEFGHSYPPYLNDEYKKSCRPNPHPKCCTKKPGEEGWCGVAVRLEKDSSTLYNVCPGMPYIDRNTPDPEFSRKNWDKYDFISIMGGMASLPSPNNKMIYPKEAKCPLKNCEVK